MTLTRDGPDTELRRWLAVRVKLEISGISLLFVRRPQCPGPLTNSSHSKRGSPSARFSERERCRACTSSIERGCTKGGVLTLCHDELYFKSASGELTQTAPERVPERPFICPCLIKLSPVSLKSNSQILSLVASDVREQRAGN